LWYIVSRQHKCAGDEAARESGVSLMKRLLGGGLAFGLAVMGSVAVAGPSLAQAPPEPEFVQLEGALSTEVAAPGEEITASSVDPCTVSEDGPGELFWLVAAFDEELPRLEDTAPLAEDGSWQVTFGSPEDAGEFVFFAACLPPGLEPPSEEELDQLPVDELELGEALAEDGGEEPVVIEFYELPFTVEGPTPTTPPTTAPGEPVAPPATPVPAQPTFTG
jgi:hypothetical protein